MNDEFDLPGTSRNVVTIPTIWLAFALSLLIHVLALWQWLPEMRFLSNGEPDEKKGSRPLQVRLVPPPSLPSAASEPARESQPAPSPRSPPPKPPPRPQPAAPAIALEAPGRGTPPSQPSPPSAPAAPAPVPGDMASLIEARRRARSEPSPPAPPAEDENARTRRIVAANLGTDRAPEYGDDPRRGGGVFEILRLGYDDAEFMFFGWNKKIARNAAQMISVRRGGNPDIRIAVVRRMIEIIRAEEKGDFTWDSRRLGRNVTLSARMEDTAGLEDFMMREFYFDRASLPR
jgi:hypothetical protein